MVLTYEVSGDEVTIKGMTTPPSDGKLVIPGEIAGKVVTTIGNSAFKSKSTITSVEFPASVKIISGSAFKSCDNLSQVTFAENSKLTSINDNAFMGTIISEVTIPESVTYIGSFGFYVNRTKKITVTMLSKTPCQLNITTNVFGIGPTIIVPAGSSEAYKNADKWSSLASRIKEAEPTSINHVTTPTSAASAAIYTLDGKLASKDGNTQALAKGIYVQNGKKVVIGK